MAVIRTFRFWIPLALLVVATFAAAPAQAGTGVQFFERSVATDTKDDFSAAAHNGALDIMAVHLSERYTYDSGNRSGKESVQFRVELRQRDAIKQMPPDQNEGASGVVLQPIEYTLGFTAGGKKMQFKATLTQVCLVSAPSPAGGGGYDCNAREPTITSPHLTSKDGGITFVLDRAKDGLPVGTSISKVWAVSAAVSQGQKTYEDAAPKDNANQPEGATLAEPATPATTYDLTGTFPFMTMTVKSPLQTYAVPGGSASFVIELRTHEKIAGIDHIYVDVRGPASWTFEGNLGTDFFSTGGNQVIEYEITAKAPTFAKADEEVPVQVDVTMQAAGGHQSFLGNIRVSGAKVDAPEYAFELKTAGPFKAESPALIQWQVQREGVALERYNLAADFLLNNKVIDANVPATETKPGTYEVSYTFPSGGLWTADVYVAELQPSPHKAFPVTVSSADGGLLPGFGLIGVWGALGWAAWRRRL